MDLTTWEARATNKEREFENLKFGDMRIEEKLQVIDINELHSCVNKDVTKQKYLYKRRE